MLEGNLQAQINYSIVKAVAAALDEKAQLLIQAESSYKPIEDESFAEAAMPEIEAMAKAVLEGCVDFQKSASGRLVKLLKSLGRILRIKKEIVSSCPIQILWIRQTEAIAFSPISSKSTSGWSRYMVLTKKMGWDGFLLMDAPEDGQHAFDARKQSLKRLGDLISIKSNFDFKVKVRDSIRGWWCIPEEPFW